jgi:hypothetical protein
VNWNIRDGDQKERKESMLSMANHAELVRQAALLGTSSSKLETDFQSCFPLPHDRGTEAAL